MFCWIQRLLLFVLLPALDSGFSEMYHGDDNKQIIVQIPAAERKADSGSPTGIAFNSPRTDFISCARLSSS